MDMDLAPIYSKPSVVFPLTLKDAIEYLASQTAGYTPNNNNLHNKIWQQLSQRLRLIFKKFPEKRFLEIYEGFTNYKDLKTVKKCLLHELSQTRKEDFSKKLRYIYCAVTMYYIRHKDSPMTSNEVPVKWLQRKKSSELDLSDFILKVENMCQTPHIADSKDNTGYETVIIDEVTYSDMASLIVNIDNLITTTYNYINPTCVSQSEIRQLLSVRNGYPAKDKHQAFLEKYYNSDIEKILAGSFSAYHDFCEALKTLRDIYDKASDRIESVGLTFKFDKPSVFPAIWDEVSNTKTEISQAELDFFACLLKIIPPRSAENKNLARQLSSGKWHLLSIEDRNQIVNYIIQMSKQTKRIVRFLGWDFSDDEEMLKAISSQLENICLRIRYPHRNKAYDELVGLYYVLNGNKEILRSGNLNNILAKVSNICKELRKAVKDTVQDEQ